MDGRRQAPVVSPKRSATAGSSVPVVRARARSQNEASPLAVIFVGVLAIAAASVIAVFSEAIVAIAVFALAILVPGLMMLRTVNAASRGALGSAARRPHPHGPRAGAHHVLVIADQALSGDALAERILGANRAQIELDILAPVLTGRIQYWVSDFDSARERAQARLERSLEWAREQGITARGEVGDPNVTSSIEDELRDFGAEEVIVLTGPSQRTTRQEREEVKRLRRELDVPVVHIECDSEGAILHVSVEAAG